MRDSKYSSIVFFSALSILSTIYLGAPLRSDVFLRESGIIIILLVTSGIIFYGMSREVKGAYMGSSVLFATLLFNFVYLYLQGSREQAYAFSHYFILLVSVALVVFGFFFSLERVGSFSREKKARKELSRIAAQLRELRSKSEVIAKELKSLEDVQPEVIVEKEKPEKRSKSSQSGRKKRSPKSKKSSGGKSGRKRKSQRKSNGKARGKSSGHPSRAKKD